MECQWCPECHVYPPILSISPPALKPLEGAETARSHSTSRPSFSILCIHETISFMYSTNVNNEICVSRFLALASSHRLLGYNHHVHNFNYQLHKTHSIRDLLYKNIQKFLIA